MSRTSGRYECPAKTQYAVEEGKNTGEYTIYGTWVVKDFIRETFNSQSELLVTNTSTNIYFKFLNPLCRQSAPVSIIVFLDNCTREYPMLMLTRIINFNDVSKSKAKETNVVFNQTAKRSYMDFDVTWQNLTKEKGYINEEGAVAIEFELMHTIDQIPIKPIPLAELMNRPQPKRLPRIVPVDNSRQKVKQVSFDTRTKNNYIVPMLGLLLFHIKKVRNIVYEIYTQYSQANNTPSYMLQQLFYQLQVSASAVNFDGFNKVFKISTHDQTTYNENSLQLIIKTLKNYWLSGDKLEELFGFTTSKNYYYGKKVISTDHFPRISVALPLVEFDEQKPLTITDLLIKYHTNPDTISNISLNGIAYDEVRVYQKLESLPEVLVLTIDRAKYNTYGQTEIWKLPVIPVESFKVKDLLEETKNEVFNCNVEYINTGLISTTPTDPSNVNFVHEAFALCDTQVEEGTKREGDKEVITYRDTRGWLMFVDITASHIEYEDIAKTKKDTLSVFVYVRRDVLEKNTKVVDIPANVRNPKAESEKPTTVITITPERLAKNVCSDELGFGRAGINIPIDPNKNASFVAELTSREFDAAKTRLWKLTKDGYIERRLEMDEKLGKALGNSGTVLIERPIDTGSEYAKPIAVFVKFFFSADNKRGSAPIEFLFSTTKTPEERIGSLSEEILAFLGAKSDLLYVKEEVGAVFKRLDESVNIGSVADGDHITVIAQFAGTVPEITFKRRPHITASHKNLVPPIPKDKDFVNLNFSSTPTDPAWYLTSIYRVGNFVIEDSVIQVPAMCPIGMLQEFLTEENQCIAKYWIDSSNKEHEFGADLSEPVQDQINSNSYTRIIVDEADDE